MIKEYFRPNTIQDAIALINSAQNETYLLGGGLGLSARRSANLTVIDLQDLGLNTIKGVENKLEIGAAVTIQSLSEHPLLNNIIREAIFTEFTLNQRNIGTIGGCLCVGEGRSLVSGLFLVLDAILIIQPHNKRLRFSELLIGKKIADQIITSIEIQNDVKIFYESVARSPKDKPLIYVAGAQWPSGRTRAVLGGKGNHPLLCMDNPTQTGFAQAIDKMVGSLSTEFISHEYMHGISPILSGRVLSRF